jgi:outer membrane protein TolC
MKKTPIKLLLLLFNFTFLVELNSQQSFQISSLQEALALAKTKNYNFVNAELQKKVAELTKKAAYANVLNPRLPISLQAVDNLNLQVSFLPAEAFGGPAGTFREVAIGQQYISTLNFAPQFDILNASSIAQVKSAKINEQLVSNQNRMSELELYDRINSIYSNILSFQAQQLILTENHDVADTILNITKRKFQEGILKKQELNEAEINVLGIQDRLEQLQINLKIQYQLFQLFFGNETQCTVTEVIWNVDSNSENRETKNNVEVENACLQLLQAKQDYKVLMNQNMPSLSFISSFNWQNLSNQFFFHTNSNTINFNYVGLRLNFDFPTPQRLANTKNKNLQIKMLDKIQEHSTKENEIKNQQLKLEYDKNLKQVENLKKIAALKKDSHQKNFLQFKENILPLDKLLLSHNDWLLSQLNLIQATANLRYAKHKIEILNKY